MDDPAGALIAVFLITLLAMLAMVGIVALVAIGALVGIGYLIFRFAKACAQYAEESRQEQERLRVQAVKEQQALALQAAELARQKELRQLDSARQAQEEAARQRLEAERLETDQLFAQWTGGQFLKKPSHEQIGTIINESTRVHSHCGKHLHVIVLIGNDGVALQWKAHMGTGAVPQVIGMRGADEMFCEWGFAGRHTARLAPGRHSLSFWINRGVEASGSETDVAFEVFVPTEPPPQKADSFKKAVNAATRQFVSRATTIATAKQKVEQALGAKGNDPDEIAVELSRLEARIKDLEQDG